MSKTRLGRAILQSHISFRSHYSIHIPGETIHRVYEVESCNPAPDAIQIRRFESSATCLEKTDERALVFKLILFNIKPNKGRPDLRPANKHAHVHT